VKKVLIPTKLDKVAANLLAEKGFEVVQDADKSIEDLAKEHSNASVLTVRSEKVTPEIIDAMPELKLVVRAGAGYNTIDTKYARRKNIDVMNTPGANSNAVAEEVIAMILAACRNVVKGDITTREGKWEKKALMGTELTGKTIGILGMGNIGRLLVKRLQGFEMNFLAYDPVLSADLAEKIGVELCSVEDIFAKADFVSLHIPENDATRGMVNKKLLGLMKEGGVLINCARAGVINEEDLRAIKAEKKITFCNDVYPKDAAGEKTVADIADLMLPHLGASTKEANFNAAKRAAEQTMAYFDKGVTNCVVNKGVPDGLDEQYQTLAFVLASLSRAYLGKGRAPAKVETSFYGSLHKYGKWMLAPIVAGISSEFDPYLDASDAESFLKERGIEVCDRDVDDNKNYGESITIDLFEGDDTINKVSVRGTIAENNIMISRVNNFDKLYLEPTGHNLFVEYSDEPGVIGKIASILGGEGINIIDIRAPQDHKLNRSLAAIKTNTPVSDSTIEKIKASVNAVAAFCYSYE
jgi:D-3-phosphoglycerate dehydrogenase